MKAFDVLLYSAAMSLGACALFPATPHAVAPPQPAQRASEAPVPLDPIRRALEDFERDRQLAPVDVEREVARLEALPERVPAQQLRLTLLRSLRLEQERAALAEKVEQLNQQLRDAQARSEALGSKIQELKAIERSLVSRPAPDAGERAPSKP
jgi:predicted RNase H-like nuclease (RuvC/YqgF family)